MVQSEDDVVNQNISNGLRDVLSFFINLGVDLMGLQIDLGALKDEEKQGIKDNTRSLA